MRRLGPSAASTWLLLCLLGLLIASACARKPAAPPEPPRPKTLPELQQAVQGLLSKNHVPGAGVALVAKDRVIWAGGVGKADLSSNRDVTAETQFRVGSISKSFVALALLQLQEENKIDLDARLPDVAPEIPVHNPWEQAHPVTVAQVLEHTAGFDDMSPREMYNLQGSPSIPMLEVLQRFPGPQSVRWPPGERMSYSNPGYGIAGYLIEKVTGHPFEQYIEKAILRPLGMDHSGFPLNEGNRALLAQGYEGNPPKPVTYRNIYLRPAGDLKSSPAGMARWVQMLLNRGKLGEVQLVRPESIARMEVPQTTLAARTGLRNGYGLGNAADLSGPIVARGHDGGIDGFFSTYRYLPVQGLGFVVLINSSASVRALQELDELVRNYLIAGLPAPEQPAVHLADAELRKFTGYYQAANPRSQLFAFLDRLLGGRRVFLRNGALYQKGLFGPAQRLVPVARNQFRLEREPEASTIFCTAEDGAQVLVSQRFYGERVSPWWPMVRPWLMAATLALTLSPILFALVWIPRKLLGRMKNVRHLSVRVAPLLAGLSLLAAILLLSQTPAWKLGTRNAMTVGVCLATWVFLFSSIGSLPLSMRSFALEVNRGVRIHSLLASLACSGLAAYLAYWRLIGLKLWAL